MTAVDTIQVMSVWSDDDEPRRAVCKRCEFPIIHVSGDAWSVAGTHTTADGLTFCPPDPDHVGTLGDHTPIHERVNVRIQYARNNYVLSGGMYDADDANEATAWDDDFCVVSVKRSPRGKWAIDGGDSAISATAYRRRYATVEDAVRAVYGDRYDPSFDY